MPLKTTSFHAQLIIYARSRAHLIHENAAACTHHQSGIHNSRLPRRLRHGASASSHSAAVAAMTTTICVYIPDASRAMSNKFSLSLSLSLSHFTISHSRTLCLPTLPDNTYTIEKSFFARAYTIQTPNSNEQLRPRVVDKERTVARSKRVCQKSLSLSLSRARARPARV